MFPASLHASDARATQSGNGSRRKMTSLRAVKDTCTDYLLSNDGLAKNASGVLDFRQFRHL